MNPHNLRKLEKRKKHNRANLANHFNGGPNTSAAYIGIYAKYNPHLSLDILPPSELLNLMKLYVNNRDAVERVLTYARRYKQAVNELEVDDIEAVKALLAVKSVMEE